VCAVDDACVVLHFAEEEDARVRVSEDGRVHAGRGDLGGAKVVVAWAVRGWGRAQVTPVRARVQSVH
jgi:hypothetical protein